MLCQQGYRMPPNAALSVALFWLAVLPLCRHSNRLRHADVKSVKSAPHTQVLDPLCRKITLAVSDWIVCMTVSWSSSVKALYFLHFQVPSRHLTVHSINTVGPGTGAGRTLEIIPPEYEWGCRMFSSSSPTSSSTGFFGCLQPGFFGRSSHQLHGLFFKPSITTGAIFPLNLSHAKSVSLLISSMKSCWLCIDSRKELWLLVLHQSASED